MTTMSDRVEEIAATHIRLLTDDAGTWGIDVWGMWFDCQGDLQGDVALIAADIRRRLACTLRAHVEEARREEREACAVDVERFYRGQSCDGTLKCNHQVTGEILAGVIRARVEKRG